MRQFIAVLFFLFSASHFSLGAELVFHEGSGFHVEVNRIDGGIIEITTTGDDPQVVFAPPPGVTVPDGATVLAFEYFCPDGVDDLEVFYARRLSQGWSQDRVIQASGIPVAEAWQPFSVNMAAGSGGHWKPEYSRIRLDFGRSPGLFLQVRNFHFRPPTPAEQAGEEEILAIRKAKLVKARAIDHYLDPADRDAEIDQVTVTRDHVVIRGTASSGGARSLFLLGYEPHENAWETTSGTTIQRVSLDSANGFHVEVPRFEKGRDRIAYRWAIAEEQEGRRALLTPAVWASDLTMAAEREMPRLRPTNRKGLSAASHRQGIFDDDFRDLGITAATVNLDISKLFTPSRETISHIHQGHTWQFAAAPVQEWDKILRELTTRNIVVSAILLVAKHQTALLHPEFERAGIYSMANLTDRDAADKYRAVISFLAERYSRPDQRDGWITHWIVFNEVDYGWVWTNMGEQPMSVYMDAYHKAMRLTWLEAVRFNPTAEVFISLTHNWDYEPRDPFRTYSPRRQLDRLARYSEVKKDFHWGVAYHPYPQSLLRPRTWEDQAPTASFDTRYITMKNIEVLDAYLRQDDFLYQGSPRTVILSEQGYHTPDYSEASFLDKAAAIAYTWQKITHLDTIETYHYHRWVDHPMEGGLRLGLRTLPTKEHRDGLRKEPAFTIFGALETDREAAAIAPLKSIIGIESWDEVRINPDDIKQ